MTRDETIKILMVIQAAYPNYKPPDKTVAVNVWAEMLSDIPYEKVSAAVKLYIQTDTSGFAPSVGDVRERVCDIFAKEDDLNETAAWSVVWKAICNSGYHAEEEFAKLPQVVQRAVHSPAQLREWALMQDIDGNTISVLQSNFQRAFRAEQQRERERNKLSPDVLKLMRPLNNTQIKDKPKELSIEEKKIVTKESAEPAPENFMKKIMEAMKNGTCGTKKATEAEE